MVRKVRKSSPRSMSRTLHAVSFLSPLAPSRRRTSCTQRTCRVRRAPVATVSSWPRVAGRAAELAITGALVAVAMTAPPNMRVAVGALAVMQVVAASVGVRGWGRRKRDETNEVVGEADVDGEEREQGVLLIPTSAQGKVLATTVRAAVAEEVDSLRVMFEEMERNNAEQVASRNLSIADAIASLDAGIRSLRRSVDAKNVIGDQAPFGVVAELEVARARVRDAERERANFEFRLRAAEAMSATNKAAAERARLETDNAVEREMLTRADLVAVSRRLERLDALTDRLDAAERRNAMLEQNILCNSREQEDLRNTVSEAEKRTARVESVANMLRNKLKGLGSTLTGRDDSRGEIERDFEDGPRRRSIGAERSTAFRPDTQASSGYSGYSVAGALSGGLTSRSWVNEALGAETDSDGSRMDAQMDGLPADGGFGEDNFVAGSINEGASVATTEPSTPGLLSASGGEQSLFSFSRGEFDSGGKRGIAVQSLPESRDPVSEETGSGSTESDSESMPTALDGTETLKTQNPPTPGSVAPNSTATVDSPMSVQKDISTQAISDAGIAKHSVGDTADSEREGTPLAGETSNLDGLAISGTNVYQGSTTEKGKKAEDNVTGSGVMSEDSSNAEEHEHRAMDVSIPDVVSDGAVPPTGIKELESPAAFEKERAGSPEDLHAPSNNIDGDTITHSGVSGIGPYQEGKLTSPAREDASHGEISVSSGSSNAELDALNQVAETQVPASGESPMAKPEPGHDQNRTSLVLESYSSSKTVGDSVGGKCPPADGSVKLNAQASSESSGFVAENSSSTETPSLLPPNQVAADAEAKGTGLAGESVRGDQSAAQELNDEMSSATANAGSESHGDEPATAADQESRLVQLIKPELIPESVESLLSDAKQLVKKARRRGVAVAHAGTLFARATEKYERAMEMSDGSADVQSEYGSALLAWAKTNLSDNGAEERLARASKLLTATLASRGDDETILFNQGLCECLQASVQDVDEAEGLYRMACAHFDRLLELNSSSRIGAFNCGLAYISRARLSSAKNSDLFEIARLRFLRAMELQPGDAKALSYYEECERQLENLR